MWEREERKQVLDGRRGKKVHMWNGCSDMREKERKEDRREIRWMKEIWKRKERKEKEKGGG
jgi:hypothetical protein